MVMKSEVMNSEGDERRVMDVVVMNGAVMDGTLTVHLFDFLRDALLMRDTACNITDCYMYKKT